MPHLSIKAKRKRVESIDQVNEVNAMPRVAAANMFGVYVGLAVLFCATVGCRHQASLILSPSDTSRIANEERELSARVEALSNQLAQTRAAAAEAREAAARADERATTADLRAAQAGAAAQQAQGRASSANENLEYEQSNLAATKTDLARSKVELQALADQTAARAARMESQSSKLEAQMRAQSRALGFSRDALDKIKQEANVTRFGVEECQNEVQAEVATAVQSKMRVGIVSQVRVQITKDLSAAVQQRLTSQGYQVESLQMTCEAKVSLGVRLIEHASGDFSIEPFPEGYVNDYQRISSNRSAPWEWLVTPYHEGRGEATVRVEARIGMYNGPKESNEAVSILRFPFVVESNRVYSTLSWIRNKSPLLLTGLCIPFIIWIAGKIWNSITELTGRRHKQPVDFAG